MTRPHDHDGEQARYGLCLTCADAGADPAAPSPPTQLTRPARRPHRQAHQQPQETHVTVTITITVDPPDEALEAVCEVRAECLAYAIDNEPLGVWGGMSPRERRKLQRTRKASRFAARCGTVGGRSAHRRRNEEPCGPCRDAYNEHERAKALRRRLAEGRG